MVGFKIAVSFWDVVTNLACAIAQARVLSHVNGTLAYYGVCSEIITAILTDTLSDSTINQSGICLCSFCFRGTCEMIETVTSGSASAHSR